MKKVTIIIKSLPYQGRYGGTYRPYSRVEVEMDEALDLVKAGHADWVEPPDEDQLKEAASYKPRQNAMASAPEMRSEPEVATEEAEEESGVEE